MDYAEIAKLATVSFGNSVKLLAQQETSLLEDTVQVEKGLTGKSAVAADFVGEFPTRQRISRLEDTPFEDINRERRWYEFIMYNGAVPIDKIDKLKTNYDPQDGLVKAAVATYKRDTDKEIMRAYFGTNITGEFRESSKSFTAGNIIAADNTASSPIIYALEDALAKLKANKVTVSKEQIFCVVDSYTAKRLRKEGLYINSDYQDGHVLTGSRLTPYAGINFVEYEDVPTYDNGSGKTVHKLPFYCKNGVGLGKWEDIFIDISQRKDKSYAWQVYAEYAMGATRLEEAKCLALTVTEA